MNNESSCTNNKLGVVLIVIGVITIIPVVVAIIMKNKKSS